MQRILAALIFVGVACLAATAGELFGGHQLVCLAGSNFKTQAAEDGLVLTSSQLKSEVNWEELIVSWNFRNKNGGLKIEVKVHYPEETTAWYTLGLWASHPPLHPRESMKGQKDQHGEVKTDTLVMKRAGGAVELRLSLQGETVKAEDLKLLTLCFSETKLKVEPMAATKESWGKHLPVPERSQANYPEGISEWCSPTATSMVLSYWGVKLNRRDLDHDVPEVAKGVHDPNWPGTGNWPFNTAYAGAHEGIRAYVTRFSDIEELEGWIGAGFPVITSVSYNRLLGRNEGGSGHLVVVIGFGKDGEMIINDPGRRKVHQIYPRDNFVRAWAESNNTVYLIYPEDAKVPENKFGHWCD